MVETLGCRAVHKSIFRSPLRNLFHGVFVAGLGLIVLSLAGCGTGVATSSGSSVTSGTFAFSGQVEGGQQPVNGATISLYAAGKTALASAPRSMLTSSVTSNSNGYFNITGKYACQSGDQVYIVATGGSAGSGPNSAIAMMTALGPCATLLANASTTNITINEVTTVASVMISPAEARCA